MKRILITGAGGFLGGQLVKRLVGDKNGEINILLRNVIKACRISCYPLNYFVGSVTDETAIKKAMENCDAVIHCAHDFSNPDANLKAADLIAREGLRQGIKKLIYISSFAVHRVDEAEIINEDTSINHHWVYAVNKTQIEKNLIEYYKKNGLPLIILRPTIIYGPFSAAWTVNTVNQMIGGRIVIPYEGEGICNGVYIDDVVQAIIKALDAPADCNGRSYIVSGPDAVSWKVFYNEHLPSEGTNAPVFMTKTESVEWQKRMEAGATIAKKNSLRKDPITFLKKTPVYTFYQKLLKNPSLKKKLLSAKTNIPRPLIYLDKDAFEIHSCRGKVDLSRIKKDLGFAPAMSFKEGMKKTRAWIKWANLNVDA